MTEDEKIGWHHWRDGPEFEQAPGDNEGQGSLACCGPRGHKQSDTTERVNNSPSGEAPRSPWVQGTGPWKRCWSHSARRGRGEAARRATAWATSSRPGLGCVSW